MHTDERNSLEHNLNVRSSLRGSLATETTGESEIFGLTDKETNCQRDGLCTIVWTRTNMVTRLAWIAAKLVSSKRETK